MILKFKEKEEVRRARVRQLFLARIDENRTEMSARLFYKWLEEPYPDLVRRTEHSSSYEFLKGDLEGFRRS